MGLRRGGSSGNACLRPAEITFPGAWLIGVQLLDGVGAGIFGAITPLVLADLMRCTGRYNIAQGVVATVQGIVQHRPRRGCNGSGYRRFYTDVANRVGVRPAGPLVDFAINALITRAARAQAYAREGPDFIPVVADAGCGAPEIRGNRLSLNTIKEVRRIGEPSRQDRTRPR